MPFVDTFKLVKDGEPPREFLKNAEVTVKYIPNAVPGGNPFRDDPDPDTIPGPSTLQPTYTSRYYEEKGLRFRESRGYFCVDGELPVVAGFKPCSFKESLDIISELDLFGLPVDAFRISRLDLCVEEPGSSLEIAESLTDLFKKAPSPHRARYDNCIYLARTPKMVQRLRCYNRTLKTNGLENAPDGADLLRFELQRRRTPIIRSQFKASRVSDVREPVLQYVMAKNLKPIAITKTVDYSKLVRGGSMGLTITGFIFLRELFGEPILRKELSKHLFYKYRKLAAGVKTKKASPDFALRALRALLVTFRPDLVPNADADQLAAVLDSLRSEVLKKKRPKK